MSEEAVLRGRDPLLSNPSWFIYHLPASVLPALRPTGLWSQQGSLCAKTPLIFSPDRNTELIIGYGNMLIHNLQCSSAS